MLDLNNVSRQYKNFQLDDITFTLDTGYIMGLIGPNAGGYYTYVFKPTAMDKRKCIPNNYYLLYILYTGICHILPCIWE